MRFTLGERLLDYEGSLRVKCTAEITDVYKGSTNVLLKTSRFPPIYARGAIAVLRALPGKVALWLVLVGAVRSACILGFELRKGGGGRVKRKRIALRFFKVLRTRNRKNPS